MEKKVRQSLQKEHKVRVKAEVICVEGTCNADLREGDTFLLEGLRVLPQNHDRVCSLAFASLVMNAGRLKIQEGPIYIACPDPGTGEGGNVMFKLSLEKSYEKD